MNSRPRWMTNRVGSIKDVCTLFVYAKYIDPFFWFLFVDRSVVHNKEMGFNTNADDGIKRLKGREKLYIGTHLKCFSSWAVYIIAVYTSRLDTFSFYRESFSVYIRLMYTARGFPCLKQKMSIYFPLFFFKLQRNFFFFFKREKMYVNTKWSGFFLLSTPALFIQSAKLWLASKLWNFAFCHWKSLDPTSSSSSSA